MELLTVSKLPASKSRKSTSSTSTSTPKKSRKKNPILGVDAEYGEDRFYRTAERAYYIAEARGFEPGYEMEDWLAAEAEVQS
jgi:hypothetical protein